ncbi:hypothetical protein S83_036352, partial [Arachis hypogaea]
VASEIGREGSRNQPPLNKANGGQRRKERRTRRPVQARAKSCRSSGADPATTAQQLMKAQVTTRDMLNLQNPTKTM